MALQRTRATVRPLPVSHAVTMKSKIIAPLILVFVIAISGCAVYPVSRTFYQVDPADGTPKNRNSCGYTNTKDSAERLVQGVEIFISPGEKDMSDTPDERLSTTISFSFPDGEVDVIVDPTKIIMEVDGEVLKPETLSATDRITRRSKGLYEWKRVMLIYPAPSGQKDNVKFVFQQGALKINGQIVPVAPFRFSRVTKSDIYYGSINC